MDVQKTEKNIEKNTTGITKMATPSTESSQCATASPSSLEKPNLKIITADERIAFSQNRKIKLVIGGENGSGKTSLLLSPGLDPNIVLYIDVDKSSDAVKELDEHLDRFEPETWQECKLFAAFLGGPNRAYKPGDDYGQKHYEYAKEVFEKKFKLDKYKVIFWDCMSPTSILTGVWAEQQKKAYNKDGVFDQRNWYGLIGSELVKFYNQLQRAPMHIIIAVTLDLVTDEYNNQFHKMRIEGAKGARELLGIFNDFITLARVEIPPNSGQKHRAFVCTKDNSYNLPAKTRAGLSEIEPPDLGHVIKKILSGKIEKKLDFGFSPEAKAALAAMGA